MIFRRTVSWSGVRRVVLLSCLFFGAFLGLRVVTMESAGQAAITELDLLGMALFALFFARLANRSTSPQGRKIIVAAVLIGPPLVLLTILAFSAGWEAFSRLIGG